MLIDSHCHLDFKEFESDFDSIIQRAIEANIKAVVNISTTASNFHNVIKAVAKVSQYIPAYATIGIHPDSVEKEFLNHKEIVALCASNQIIGIGETGLDYTKTTDFNKQKESFIEHIKAANLTNLPLVVHTREAQDDTYIIMKDMMDKSPYRAVMHCFTGDLDFAKKCLDLGFYISFSGIVTFKNAQALQEVAKFVPLDSMLIETDAPFLAPMPMRGKRNEPAYLKYTAEFLANLKRIPFEEFCANITDNFKSLFNKAIL